MQKFFDCGIDLGTTNSCLAIPDDDHGFEIIENQADRMQVTPSAILINTGRGPLVDEEAVANALANGELAAYGADVMTEEPPRADNPLLAQPHAYITPHIAWATKEARERLMKICVENIQAFVEGRDLNHV